jgi:glycogen phosphorylase
MSFTSYSVPYPVDDKYKKKVAYFSMEFATHQPLKIYSGGLGFLAGSHLRSAYELRQNHIGIGILWKYGYYDQERNQDQTRWKCPGMKSNTVSWKIPVSNSRSPFMNTRYG